MFNVYTYTTDVLSVGCPDGSIVATEQNPAVSAELLAEIFQWREAGATEDDVIERLRMRTVPPGYTPHLWNGSHPG